MHLFQEHFGGGEPARIGEHGEGTHPALRARSMTFTDSATNRPDAKRSGAPSGSMARARPTSCLGVAQLPVGHRRERRQIRVAPARKDVCDLFMGPSIR